MSSRACRMAFITFMHQVGDITSTSGFYKVFEATEAELAGFFKAAPEKLFIPPHWLNVLFEKMETESQRQKLVDFQNRLMLQELTDPVFYQNPNRIKNTGRPGPRDSQKSKPSRGGVGAYERKITPLKTTQEDPKISRVPVLKKQPFPSKDRLTIIVATAFQCCSRERGNYLKKSFIMHLHRMLPDVTIRVNNFETIFTLKGRKHPTAFKFSNNPKFV